MQITFPGNKKVEVEYKGFKVLTDQPKTHGGEGTAPTPFDLFLVSIGACAGFYVLDFCQERSLPADNINLTVDIDKNPDSKMVEKIEVKIALPPEFPDKYKNAVVKAAGLCTVKKHLLNPPEIVVSTASSH